MAELPKEKIMRAETNAYRLSREFWIDHPHNGSLPSGKAGELFNLCITLSAPKVYEIRMGLPREKWVYVPE